jgi:hypothetical protein
MTMMYTRSPDKSFTAWAKGSEALVALQNIPDERRPELLPADHPEVSAWVIAEARRLATQRTIDFANDVRAQIAKSQHYLQAARWPIQLASAQAIKAGNPSPFDLATIGREARLRGRGETAEQLADKVLSNSTVFASVGAAVDGIETATLDAVAGYTGDDPAWFDRALAGARDVALAEFMDIFTPVVGAEGAQARAAAFFG